MKIKMAGGMIKKAGACLAIALLVCVYSLKAQIPNAGFENWADSTSFSEPTGWATLNQITSFYKVFTCQKGSPGHPGNNFMRLVTQNIPSVGVVPAVAACGTLDSKAMPASGFAWNVRSKQLEGNYMYEPVGYDNGTILVYLTAWNGKASKRDTVAAGSFLLQESLNPAWAPFAINLTYKNNLQPDSAIIYMAASRSNPHAGTTLSIDSLSFTGMVTGIDRQDLSVSQISVYPNPAADLCTISGLVPVTVYEVAVKDISGRILMDVELTVNQGSITMPVSEIPQGLYLLEIKSTQGTAVQKFLKTR